jgi:hypothetical protein
MSNAIDANGGDRSSHSQSSNRSGESSEIACNACGFESAFVPEGMMPCGRCHTVHYCSLHCLKWDWNSGGHAKICVDKRVDLELESVSSHSGGILTDDGTMASMDPNAVFGDDEPVVVEKLSNIVEKAKATSKTKKGLVNANKAIFEKKIEKGGEIDKPKPKLGSYFKKHNSADGIQQGLKRDPGPVPGQRALYQQDREDIYGDYQEDDEDHSDQSPEQSIQVTSQDYSEEELLLQSIVEEDVTESDEPEVQGSWRSRDHFDVPEDSSRDIVDDMSESSNQMLDFAEEGYSEEEEEEEYVQEENAEVDDSEDSYTSEKGERGIFVATGSEKRDALSLSPEHSIESAVSKRMKGKMQTETSTSPSTSRVISPENGSGDAMEDTTETAAAVESPAAASPPSVLRAPPRNDSGDSVFSAAMSLKDFRTAYTCSTAEDSGTNRGNAVGLMDFRDLYRPEAFPEKKVANKSLRRLSMVEMTNKDKEKAPRSKKKRRMSLEDQLDNLSQSTAERGNSLIDDTNHSSVSQPAVSESLKKSVTEALRDYEAMHGKAATDEAIKHLTSGIEKEHKQQKADRRHEEILNSSWGPGSVTAALSDSTYMNNSSSSSSGHSFMPEPSPLDSQMSVVSTDSDEEDRRMLAGGHLMGTATGALSGNEELSTVSESGIPPPSLQYVPAATSGKAAFTSDGSSESREGEQTRVGGVAMAGAATTVAVAASSVSSSGEESRSTPNAPMPRYMQYRTSLARSSDTAKSSDVPKKTNDRQTAEENNESESNPLLVGAGTAVAASALTLGTSGSDDPGTAQVAASPSAAPSGAGPRYMKYRTSLAKSTEGTQQVEAARTLAEETSPPTRDVSADQASSGDKDESKSNALLEGAGVAVAAGVVTAGTVTGTSGSGENTATTSGTPSSSIPRYMQYRSSLARSTGVTDSAETGRPLNDETNQAEKGSESVDADETSSEDMDESKANANALLVGAGAAVAAGAVTAGIVAGTSGSGENAGTPGGTSSGSTPRYMQYRTSLARSTEGTQQVELARTVADETSQEDKGSESVEAADQTSPEDKDESKSNALLVGAGAAVAAGAVTAGIVTGTSGSGENTATTSGTPSSSIPRYMQYRTSLARSTEGNQQVELARTVAEETSQEEKGSESVEAADQASSEDKDESKSNALLVGAGAAVAGGAVTAGIMAGTSGSGENAGTPSGSMPRYMQYRSSLARSTGVTDSAEIRRNLNDEANEAEKGSESVVKAADQASSEDKDESKSNALLVGAGAAVAGGAVTAGIMAGTSGSGENSATTSGTPSGSMPRYMQYRTSLARSTDASTRGDQAEKTGQHSLAPKDNQTPSAEESSGSSDTGASGSSFDSKAALVGAGIATAGAATAGVLSGTPDGATAAPSAEQTPGDDDVMAKNLAYQASIGEKLTDNERVREVDEGVATPESAKKGESADATGRANNTPVVPPSVLKVRDGSGDEMGPDKGVRATGSDGDHDDIETGVTEEATKALSSPGGHSITRRRLECLLLFLIVLACAFGFGFGIDNSSSKSSEEGNGNAPTLSPAVIIGTPAPSILTTNPSQAPSTEIPTQAAVTTESPVQLTVTDPPVSAPTRAPAMELPVSTPTAVPTTLIPTTISPTRSPATDQDLFDLLVAVSFDNGTRILTQRTPQNLAYEWLASSANLDTLPDNRKIQRYALATFFYSTGGDSWLNSVAWLSQVDECSWYSRSTLRPNCNEAGAYENLDLGFNGVSGSIPPEVALLSELTRIQLSGGTLLTLTGSLPSELGLLASLESFSVQRNSLTGSLPPEIGALTALDQLDLSENKFLGSLPSEIGGLTALTGLNLTTNEFTGSLPTTFARLVGLEVLSLADNAFEGSVPAQLGLLAQLQTLSLETNGFSAIPRELGFLRNLGSLTIFENSLTGTLHSELGALSNLRTLNMRSNEFTGTIPPQYGSLTTLRELDLSSNALNGLIPVEIGLLTRLLGLYLQANRLSGQIPPELGFLTRVSEIRVDDNDLTGSIPDAVCDVFASTLPTFYSDCAGQPPEIDCPPGSCCTYCCEDGVGCDCVYGPGSPFEFLC